MFVMSFLKETNITFIVNPLYPPRPIQASILLSVAVISIPCFIFLLYHFLTNQTLYSALNNHVVILLLISNTIQTLIDVPVHLAYYYKGTIWPPTVEYCQFWYFIDDYTFTLCYLLLTWASIERHILIFHTRLYNTHFKRLIGHYIPLGFCWVYPLIYYVGFELFYPCENYYDVTVANCVAACFELVSNFMDLYEQIVHGLGPMFMILFFNVTLIIRVLQQKRRMGRQLTWSQNRKMTIQLLSICSLPFITNGGYFIIRLVRMLGYESFGVSATDWLYPLGMLQPPFMAFVGLYSLPDLKHKLKQFIVCQRRNGVVPLNSIPLGTTS